MTQTIARSSRGPSTTWVVAVIAALLTHVGILASVELLGVFEPPDLVPTPRPIDLVFSRPADQAGRPEPAEEPTRFSELPEDRADVAPDDPDFLSNVDSRARDRALAEAETDLPRMEGRSDAAQVALEEAGGGAVEAQPEGEDGDREEASEADPGGDQAPEDLSPGEAATRAREGAALSELLRDRDQGRSGDPGAGESGLSGRPGRRDEAAIREAPGSDPRYSLRAHGSAYFQEEMNNPGGNVSLFGDISLNTLNWEFAPWIQRFIRDFHRNWVPPYAYALGIIEGYEVVDVEVAPDGRLLRLDVLEAEGHEALEEATLTAFRSFAPYHALPTDFPEPTLKMTVTVRYPDWR